MMGHIKKIILFLARVLASTFASFFVALPFFIAGWVLQYIAIPGELSNSIMCYIFHAISLCEFNFLSLLDLFFTSPSLYEPSSFIIEGLGNIYKFLIQSVLYVFPGFIALLFFKFMWNDTRLKNKDFNGDGNG